MAREPVARHEHTLSRARPSWRVFGNKSFMRFARKFGASDRELWDTAQGEPDADLGGGVYKFRLAREGEGLSGGARLIAAMKKGERIVMMFGFEKKDMANIDSKELKGFKKLAKIYLGLSEREMGSLVKDSELMEIKAAPAEQSSGTNRAKEKLSAIEAKECEHGESSKKGNADRNQKENRK
jgi:hypothetical protein